MVQGWMQKYATTMIDLIKSLQIDMEWRASRKQIITPMPGYKIPKNSRTGHTWVALQFQF